MIKEKASHLDWYTPYEILKDNDVHRFPFCVLEIKLQGDYIDSPPEWINDLMKSNLIINVPKFSKFSHSSYIFYDNLRTPYWIDSHPEFFEELPKNTNNEIKKYYEPSRIQKKKLFKK